ncbi:hypothetical protein GCM10029992_61800 [Glycomyces albus]
MSGALELPDADLPVEPYTLGCWLGDGTTGSAQFTCADDEILEGIRADGYLITKHPSSKIHFTISSEPERERRIGEAISSLREEWDWPGRPGAWVSESRRFARPRRDGSPLDEIVAPNLTALQRLRIRR